MNKILSLKQFFLICCLLFTFVSIESASAQPQNNAVHWTKKQAYQWTKQREWANGLKAIPHKSTNYIEFASQYHKNKVVWDKVFQWLATHDLLMIPAGKYEIDNHNYINVQDAKTQDASKRKIEGHRHGIDLQYVVKGTERFGITSAKYTTPETEYVPDVTFYKAKKIKYVDSTPDCFFMFFPGDYHQALVQAGKEPEKIRVIVAKIEYLP